MNIIDVQNNLKNLTDQQLAQEMNAPSGTTPPFLVLTELNRRKEMRNSFQAQQAGSNKTTVAQDVVSAAGVPQGPASAMAQSLAPKTDMTNNTGIAALPQGAGPQRMASGGVVKLADGGSTSKNKPDIPSNSPVYTDPAVVAYANRMGMSVYRYLHTLPPEDRDTVVAQAQARAARAKRGATEPSLSDVSAVGADPSYRERPSEFPVDFVASSGPAFESSDYGRSGRPTMAQRVAAANTPGIYALTQPTFDQTGRDNPSFATRVGRVNNTSLDDLATQNALEMAAGTNAVRPGVVAPNAPNLQQVLDAIPGMDQRKANREELAAAARNARAGVMTGATVPTEPPLQDQLAALPGMDQRKANREELAAAAQADRAGPQTALPARVPPEWVQKLQNGPKAVSRSGQAPGHQGYDPLAGLVDSAVNSDFVGMLGGRTAEEQRAIDARRAALAAQGPVDPREANAMRAAAARVAAPVQTPPVVNPNSTTTGTGGTGGTGTGGSGTGGTGGAGAGAASPYEQQLMDALSRNDKRERQDKWMALAQMGLALMSSSAPNIGAALGEAGTAGLQAFRGARDTAEEQRLKLQSGIYDLEQQRLARAAAGARGRGVRPLDDSVIKLYATQAAGLQAQLDSGLLTPDQQSGVKAQLDKLTPVISNLTLQFAMQHGADPSLMAPMLGAPPADTGLDFTTQP